MVAGAFGAEAVVATTIDNLICWLVAQDKNAKSALDPAFVSTAMNLALGDPGHNPWKNDRL